MLIENASSVHYIAAKDSLCIAEYYWQAYESETSTKDKNRALRGLEDYLDTSREYIYISVTRTYRDLLDPHEKNNIGFVGKAILLIGVITPQLYYSIENNNDLKFDQIIEIIKNHLKVALADESNYMTIERLGKITGLSSSTITKLRDSLSAPDVIKGIEYIVDLFRKIIERQDDISILNNIVSEYVLLSHKLLSTRGKTYNLNFNESKNNNSIIDTMNKTLGTSQAKKNIEEKKDNIIFNGIKND